MENGYDLNLIRCDLIKYSEGKTPNDRASEVSVGDRIKIRSMNDPRENVVDHFHELDVQIFALVGFPLVGHWRASASSASASGVNRMIMCGLAGLHEFSFDLVPSATLSGIGSGPVQSSIEFSLLSIG